MAQQTSKSASQKIKNTPIHLNETLRLHLITLQNIYAFQKYYKITILRSY